MKRSWVIGTLAVLIALGFILYGLTREYSLITHPKGLIAHKELQLIKINVALMLLIIVPTAFLVIFAAWKYRSTNPKATLPEESSSSGLQQLVLWLIPSVVVAVMAVITWIATHQLDPYKPIESTQKPYKIQVIAIDWKWLFIYPEEGIASLNLVVFPEKTPIHFELAADGSPMNSFWIPQLSGQIYCMTGMVTPLHLMADGAGKYTGRAAEINGEGYASMIFEVESKHSSEFDTWIKEVKQSENKLTKDEYQKLLIPSQGLPVILYSAVEENLFDHTVMKYTYLD